MKSLKTTLAVTALAAIAMTSAAHAAGETIAKPTQSLLNELARSRNDAQFVSVRYDLSGYVNSVETKTENGQKFYLAEIGDTLYKDGSVSSSTLSSRLLCVTDDRQAVAGLSRGKLVSFTAFGADVQNIPVRNPATGVTREFRTLIARCNF